jgi:H+/Cl- antiporter ClcA
VSTSFGATIGGVLFSIEVTSNFYLIENLWKSFFVATIGTLLVYLFSEVASTSATMMQLFAPLDDAKFILKLYSPYELLFFALVGVVGGMFGSLVVQALLKVVKRIRRWPQGDL